MNDPIYIFDGGFEGLLTALALAVAAGALSARFVPAGAPGAAGQGDLFSLPLRVIADSERAGVFMDRVRNEISDGAAGCVLQLWWAEQPELFTPLHEYLALGFKHGPGVNGFRTHPAVRTVIQAARKVGLEAHRLMGLLRFRELADGSLYAPVSPDANVALVLGWHFRQRLAGERWVIHDLRRGLGVFWDGRRLESCEIASGPAWAAAGTPAPAAAAPSRSALPAGRRAETRYDEAPSPAASSMEVSEGGGVWSVREAQIQELWKSFFGAVAIPERHNPEQQRRCMPRRYWKYLVEIPQEQGAG